MAPVKSTPDTTADERIEALRDQHIREMLSRIEDGIGELTRRVAHVEGQVSQITVDLASQRAVKADRKSARAAAIARQGKLGAVAKSPAAIGGGAGLLGVIILGLLLRFFPELAGLLSLP